MTTSAKSQPGISPSTGSQPSPKKVSAFDGIAEMHQAQKFRLKYLRYGFQLAASGMSADIAGAFEKYQNSGPIKSITVNRSALKKSFAEGIKAKFNPRSLEAFIGEWQGVNRSYDQKTRKENEERAATWYMRWEKGKIGKGDYVQRVVGSKERHFRSDELPDLSEKKVDLALNVYKKDIGITGWLSAYVEFRMELALISYQLGTGTFLWIGQFLAENLQMLGSENSCWMFLEWLEPTNNSSYYMYGLQFELDFDRGKAKVIGDDVRKAEFKRVNTKNTR